MNRFTLNFTGEPRAIQESEQELVAQGRGSAEQFAGVGEGNDVRQAEATAGAAGGQTR